MASPIRVVGPVSRRPLRARRPTANQRPPTRAARSADRARGQIRFGLRPPTMSAVQADSLHRLARTPRSFGRYTLITAVAAVAVLAALPWAHVWRVDAPSQPIVLRAFLLLAQLL